MSDVWRGWTITEDQRVKMAAGDREALDRFYFDNYSHLFALAKNYAHRKACEGFGDLYRSEELMQDLYVQIPRLDFTNVELFRGSLKWQFYRGAYSEAWTNNPITQERREAIFNTKYWIDAPRHDNKPDGDERIIDKFASYPDAYRELIKAREDARQDRLEEDLEVFLKELLTEKQLEIWSKGWIIPAIEIKLRRNAQRVVAFLRAHGTPRSRLEHDVLPVVTQSSPERKRQAQEARARRAWELEHLEELSPERRRQVLKNQKQRNKRAKVRDVPGEEAVI